MAFPQIPITLNTGNVSHDVPPLVRCHKIWVRRTLIRGMRGAPLTFVKDNRTARFTPCALPYVATVPAILGALVLLTYSLRLFNRYQPKWTKPFVKEEKENPDELSPPFWSRPLSATFGLLLVSMIGLTMQLLASFLPTFSYDGIYPSIAWVRHPRLFCIYTDRSGNHNQYHCH